MTVLEETQPWIAAKERPNLRNIVEQHGHFVGRSLRYLGIREAEVLDVTQEVFLVVHRRLDDFEGRSSVKTWLYGICVRVAAAHRRRAFGRYVDVVAEPPEQSAPASQDEELRTQETRKQLLQILDSLDEDQRVVFVLYEIEQLSMKEIAETLGCPLQTAYYRHQAARKAVMQVFQQGDAKEDP